MSARGVKGAATIWVKNDHGMLFVDYVPRHGYLEYRLAGSEDDTLSKTRAELEDLRDAVAEVWDSRFERAVKRAAARNRKDRQP